MCYQKGDRDYHYSFNPIFTGGLELRYLPGRGRFAPPPTISVRSGPIFKKLDSMVSPGAKELRKKNFIEIGPKIRLLRIFEENRHARLLRIRDI